MKKLVNLSPSEIEYVKSIAKSLVTKDKYEGNFSKALRLVINEHKDKNGR